jgi:hypothetical protein
MDEWEDTKWTLHLYCQIIGKIRLTLMPPQNHWWHVPLYVSSRGITTRPIPYKNGGFEIEIDCIDHKLRVTTSTGVAAEFYLTGQSVAEFYRQLFSTLGELGIEVEIISKPFGIPITTPFAEDNEHASYDPEYVHRYWQALLWINGVMSEFMGRFLGKTTPIHLFWHSFDLALTRYSGRRARRAWTKSHSNRRVRPGSSRARTVTWRCTLTRRSGCRRIRGGRCLAFWRARTRRVGGWRGGI